MSRAVVTKDYLPDSIREKKRTPLIIDRFLALSPHQRSEHVTEPALLDSIIRNARRARRFVFSSEASKRLGAVVRDIPDLIVREQQFARAPFDQCWIEIDHRSYWETVTGRETDKDGDLSLAFFIDHDRVYLIVGGTVAEPLAGPHLGFVYYDLHTPWALEEQIAFCNAANTSRRSLDLFFWGETAILLDEDQQRSLRGMHSMAFTPTIKSRAILTTEIWKSLFSTQSGAAGELRTVLAILLMLNRPGITSFAEVPRGKGFVRGRPLQYLSHSVVEIKTDPVPILRQIGTVRGEGTPKRRHEVRGFWRHDRPYHAATAAGCIHEWKQDPQHADEWHWRCQTCTGRRWWVTAHVRGSALRGFVAHDGYEITSGARETGT